MMFSPTRLAWALMLACLPAAVQANGIAINEQSVSGMGSAFAGRASVARDASVLYGNPAGLSRLDRAQLSGGFGLIDASTKISQASGSSNDGDMVPLTGVPFAYYAAPLNDDWHWGVGLYAPYGLISDYEKSFAGRYQGLYSKVEVVSLQPTLSYRINERLSVGFGPTFNRIKGKLVSNLNNQALGGSGDSRVSVKGDDTALGFNAGLLVAVSDRFDWGLTYHSKVDYRLRGKTAISGGNGLLSGANGDYGARLDFTTPESLDTSISYRFAPQWTLHAGSTWTRWSRLQSIEVENRGTPTLAGQQPFASISEELRWRDTWSHALGLSYQAGAHWVLRGGLAFDPSPTRNADRTARIPVGNRKVFALGAGWSPSPDLTLDLAYAYLHESAARVDQPARQIGPATVAPAYSARFRNSAHGIGVQLTRHF